MRIYYKVVEGIYCYDRKKRRTKISAFIDRRGRTAVCSCIWKKNRKDILN